MGKPLQHKYELVCKEAQKARFKTYWQISLNDISQQTQLLHEKTQKNKRIGGLLSMTEGFHKNYF